MFRRIYRRYRKLVLLFTALYLVTCVLLMTSLHAIDGRPKVHSFFERVYDPFGSKTYRRCEASNTDVSDVHARTLTTAVKYEDRCYTDGVKEWSPDIDMETVWDTVDVSYPKLILTVTGWVEPVQVLTWRPKPLHVIIMPHSHQDPGWTETLDGYFLSKTRKTLDLLVEKLAYFPERKFVWTEVVFLHMWWTTATRDQRKKFLLLLHGGQLEILTGGWVMTDESVAHYSAMLDQLTEGHLWLNQTLGLTVDNGWAIDPFGHSSTMSYLLANSGIHTNVIMRAHFAIKKHVASTKSLEFYWKQYWDRNSNRRVRTHVMPFHLYGISYTCGPDRTVCCQFDFYKKQCFRGSSRADTLKVDDRNVAELSYALWEQLQKKSELFRNNVLLVPHGDDFRFNTAEEWDIQFGYLRKIMRYINNEPSMNMKIEFGTLSDYYIAINKSPGRLQYHDYPTLSGDLFPYSDRGDQYWSGIYSVRPFYKYMIRKLQALLRSAEILFTFCLSKMSVDTNMLALYKTLEAARRGLALQQHHDAITGTSRKVVVADYATRLKNAMNAAQIVVKESTGILLQADTVSLTLRDSYEGSTILPKAKLLRVGTSPATVVVTNSLGYHRHEIVHVLVNRSSVAVTDQDGPVRHQISPAWTPGHHVNNGQFMLSFEVEIAPFSIYSYIVKQVPATPDNPNVAKIFNLTTSDTNIRPFVVSSFPFKIVHERRPTVAFSNMYLTAFFSTCDGMLKYVRYHGEHDIHKSDVHFVVYTTGERSPPFKDKSGAYTFVPDRPAQELKYHHPLIKVTQGSLFTEVKTVYRDIVHTATLYNITGIQGQGVHIDNVINMSQDHWNNQELAMRVETDVTDSQHTFCTDVNGFQLHRRKTRAKMTIQGNFYPQTTMAFLENTNTRFSLMSASSHGVASLVSGWLEVVLDRRLMQDDWRGLGENVDDNVASRSSFVVMFEKRNRTFIDKVPTYTRMCLPSITSDHLSECLNNPLLVMFSSPVPPAGPLFSGPDKLHIASPFPCDTHVVNFRMLPADDKSSTKQALLVLHRKGYDCGFPHLEEKTCPPKITLQALSAYLDMLDVASIDETTLTGTRTITRLDRLAPLKIPEMEIKTYKVGFT